jgi:hypothetical protein
MTETRFASPNIHELLVVPLIFQRVINQQRKGEESLIFHLARRKIKKTRLALRIAMKDD